MMLMELAGIKIAAMSGESMAFVANESPMMLYPMDNRKLNVTIFFPALASFKSLSIFPMASPEIIASHAGVK
jgi:hypothetical protein